MFHYDPDHDPDPDPDPDRDPDPDSDHDHDRDHDRDPDRDPDQRNFLNGICMLLTKSEGFNHARGNVKILCSN